MSILLSAFKAARKVSTPLVAIAATPAPAATIEVLQSGFEDNPLLWFNGTSCGD